MNKDNIKTLAQAVLHNEADAIKKLAERIDDEHENDAPEERARRHDHTQPTAAGTEFLVRYFRRRRPEGW